MLILKSLGTIIMNEIFPFSFLTVKSLIFLFGNRDKDKRSGEDEIGTIFLKSDIYDPS